MPGYKTSKDRLTLLFDGNVSSDMRLKPLLVFHSEDPRALKNRLFFLLCGRITPKFELNRPFTKTGFSTTLSQR